MNVKSINKYCIKNAPIKLSPGYNCTSGDYFMAIVVPFIVVVAPLLSMIAVQVNCHWKSFALCAFPCLVYVASGAHEYATSFFIFLRLFKLSVSCGLFNNPKVEKQKLVSLIP